MSVSVLLHASCSGTAKNEPFTGWEEVTCRLAEGLYEFAHSVAPRDAHIPHCDK